MPRAGAGEATQAFIELAPAVEEHAKKASVCHANSARNSSRNRKGYSWFGGKGEP